MRDELLSIWPDGGLGTILDLGCRDCWFTAGLPGVVRHVGVEIWPEALALGTKKASEGNIPHFEGIQADALQYCEMSTTGAFDAVLAIDLVEHLGAMPASILVNEMARVASRLAVAWTTLGMIEQGAYDVDGKPNPYEQHNWGPTGNFFEGQGWQVAVYPEWHGDRGGAILAWLSK